MPASQGEVPWHRDPKVIAFLLVAVAPIGVPLMWLRFSWKTNAKLVASVVSVGLFGVLAWRINAQRVEMEAARSSKAASSTTAPAPTTAHTKAIPAPAPVQALGPALLEDEPLLGIPANLDGFNLAMAGRLPAPALLGANAVYTGANKHLVAHINVVRPDVKTEPDTELKSAKVGQHEARLGEDKAGKTITISWSTSDWNGLVSIDYERSVDRSDAEKALHAVASKSSALLDAYLTGSPPTEAERQQQLATIAEANASAKVEQFMSKIQTAGITADLVSSAHLKGDVNELIISVGSTWHHVVRQERLMSAQKLWELWANINTPTDIDASRITLVDANGNRVGGSGVMGSSVEVDK